MALGEHAPIAVDDPRAVANPQSFVLAVRAAVAWDLRPCDASSRGVTL